ncbi:MAG: ABC transporter ATP-binding protein [Alphaproteobacteria bacterium]|nr:ABC transporter ATP-binding protein [Alphaproteobacteria bacterium]
MASISFRNVSKSYGKTQALDNVSFEVEDNAFFCLFGPPLCGKSTILKIILGLVQPDEGEVLIDGRPVTHVAPAQRNVAMVFQNLALFPHMTADQNVRFPLVERGTPIDEIDRRVSEIAEKLHISHILQKPPAQLSGGERQRVAIARALVRDPVAYLMDDPISALDARLREQTRVELRRLQQDLGHTLVYVTHDQEEAMSVADSMAIMEQGRIRQIGAPEALYDQPNSEYVARLLGSPAINIVPTELFGTDRTFPEPPAFPGNASSVGIRPEDLQVHTRSDQPNASVISVEPLGGFTTLTLEAQGVQLRATLRSQPDFTVGEKVALAHDTAQSHFFDKAGSAIAAAT